MTKLKGQWLQITPSFLWPVFFFFCQHLCGLLHERHVAVKWYKMRYCTPTDGARGEEREWKERLIFRGRKQMIEIKIDGAETAKWANTHNNCINLYFAVVFLLFYLQGWQEEDRVSWYKQLFWGFWRIFSICNLPGSFIAVVDIIMRILPFLNFNPTTWLVGLITSKHENRWLSTKKISDKLKRTSKGGKKKEGPSLNKPICSQMDAEFIWGC